MTSSAVIVEAISSGPDLRDRAIDPLARGGADLLDHDRAAAVARTSTLSPGLMPTLSRTSFGSVTCPFRVTAVLKGTSVILWYQSITALVSMQAMAAASPAAR